MCAGAGTPACNVSSYSSLPLPLLPTWQACNFLPAQPQLYQGQSPSPIPQVSCTCGEVSLLGQGWSYLCQGYSHLNISHIGIKVRCTIVKVGHTCPDHLHLSRPVTPVPGSVMPLSRSVIPRYQELPQLSASVLGSVKVYKCVLVNYLMFSIW